MTHKKKIIIGVSVVGFILVIMLLNWLSNVREAHRQALEVLNREGTEIQNEIDKVDEEIANRSYQQVFTFSGTGTKNSEPFMIQGDRFKVTYECTGDYCGASLRQVNGFGGGIIMNVPGSTQDETIFYGSGEYYIEASTMGSFSITIEDHK